VNRWLPMLSVHRRVTVLVLFIAQLVLGAIALWRLPLQMMPDGFEPRSLWVRVAFPNATPSETDELVVRPIAEQLATLPGLKSVRSRAGQDSASFSLEFHPSVAMSEAYNDVVDRMERARIDLPEEADRYWVFKYSPTDEPILFAGVTFPDGVEDPAQWMDKVVVPRLERLPGVAGVEVWGAQSRAIYIDYARDRLLTHGVDVGSIQRSLGNDNFQRSGGRLDEDGRIRHVRSLSRIDDVEALERYPIQGGTLTLSDVADVSLRRLASADIDRINGRDAAAFGIRKDSSANTVEVGAAVQAALDEIRADPRAEGAEFLLFFSQGDLIQDTTSGLITSLVQGGVLSVLVLLAFLREWRMTLLVAGAIPFSMLMTVSVMYLRGGSLNVIATMGLMLAVGMVVDNAIVVVEAIYGRRGRGEDPATAAIEGTAEVNLAVLASTATSMIVFLPVILMTEDADAAFFMAEIGLPVVFSLAASLVVALLFAPLATTLVSSDGIKPDAPWLVWLTARYERLLAVVMRRRADSWISIAAAFLLTVAIAVPGVQCTGEGEGGLNDFNIQFTVPRDATPPERDAIAKRFEALFESHKEDWGIKVYQVEIGGHDSEGRAWVVLNDDVSREALLDRVKAALPKDEPGVVASVGWRGTDREDQLTITVFGEEMDVLRSIGDEVVRRVEGVVGVLDARVDIEADGADELRIRPDRAALERAGVSAATVAGTVAFALRASEAMAPIVKDDVEIDVASRLSAADLADISTLLDFPVWSPATGQALPVRALADTEFGRGPGTIRRLDQRTSVEVVIDLAAGETAGTVGEAVQRALADMALPRGYSVDQDAWKRDQSSQDTAMLFALGMSVCFVYLLMGILFESWILPMSILTTIPMALCGAFWSLYLTGTEMDVMAGIGLVVLVGVVVNNGIVLVDRIQQARSEGMSREEAIAESCRTRLRPVLMTAATTILGLLPMALGTSDFIGIPYAPLGRCVMGGMAVATVLTLLLVPMQYAALDDLSEWLRGTWGRVWRVA
jgi:HAE1 family hydrophobic/amphiphilic exporter-1